MDLIIVMKIFAAYLSIVGTWEIAQSTTKRGGLGDVKENDSAEESYNILSALNPKQLYKAFRWFFITKSCEAGVEDMVILKARFNGGLRILLFSLLLSLFLTMV